MRQFVTNQLYSLAMPHLRGSVALAALSEI